MREASSVEELAPLFSFRAAAGAPSGFFSQPVSEIMMRQIADTRAGDAVIARGRHGCRGFAPI
jgi:hypothetical protein